MLIVDEMIEPARREHAYERLFGAAGGLQCLLEDIDLAPHGIGCPALDRPSDNHFLLRRKKPGLFAGHAECRADTIHILVELWKRIAFAGLFPPRSAFTRPQLTRCHPAELLPIVEKIPAVPEFAVADAVDSDLNLLFDHLDDLRGRAVGARSLSHVGRYSHGRQPASMGRSDRGFASPHFGLVLVRLDPIA